MPSTTRSASGNRPAEDPSPLTALRPNTPTTLDNVVRRCLEKQPQDRFQSALAVVFGDGRLARTLWRVGIAGDRPPERIEIAGREALFPAIARSRDRPFARALRNRGICPSQPVLASAFADDSNSDLSPDGLRIAFESDRSGGSLEIWLSNADGSHPMQLTRGPGLWQGAPHWSPDGRRIAFDSLGADGHWDVWTMDADGGSPRRLTRDPGDEHGGSCSGDGRFVYFTSPHDGSPEVWRIPSGGGPPERLTPEGGWRPRESLDGKTLLFKPSLFDGPLLALPLAGGPVRRIVDCVGGFTRVGEGLVGAQRRPRREDDPRQPGCGRRRRLDDHRQLPLRAWASRKPHTRGRRRE